MSQEKPEENTSNKPATEGSEAAEGQGTTTAAPATDYLGNLDESQQNYLKSLGVTELTQDTLAKIINSGIKQKDSVSKMSQEVESYKIQLESAGKRVEEAEEKASRAQEPAEPPVQSAQQQSTVESHDDNKIISEDDLFMFARMIKTDFPALKEEAEDGRLFGELRQLGYFGVGGIKTKAAYEYLTKRNAQQAELNELREFKKKASQPVQGQAPSYEPTYQLKESDKMTEEAARMIIAESITKHDENVPRLNEARQFLQRKAANIK